MKKIITIGREYGAGGRSIGKAVAKELGIAFYDRDLILAAANESPSITPAQMQKYDETVPVEAGLAQSLFNFYAKPFGEQLWKAQVEAIRHIADKESCVLVGRNADYILREFDHVLRVFVYADRQWRINHMCELQPERSPSEIANDMNHVDKARKNYCTKYTGQTYGFMGNYDLTINVGKLGIDKTVELILAAAENI